MPTCPPAGAYAVGMAYLPDDDAERARRPRPASRTSPRARACGSSPGATCRSTPDLRRPRRPRVHAALPPALRRRPTSGLTGIELDRVAFCLRKRAEHEAEVYFPSLSARTIVYKGMLTTGQLEPFFPDLSDERFASELALVHSRFSTNTFPSWPLAHPYRLIAHNGEINTVKGNRNWMRARESQISLRRCSPATSTGLFPICTPGASDSATFDEVLELLHLGGRVAAARGADDDPGGLGEPRVDGPRPAGVLRVPLHLHGAVGRPGLRHLHRRHA